MAVAFDIESRVVTELSGVGPKAAQQLAKLGIETLQDLLFHLPFRYQNRTQITPIGALRDGADAVIEGTIVLSDVASGRRRSLLCRIEDGTGMVSMRLFYFNNAQQQQLRRGEAIRCFGEVRRGASGLELYHPEYSVARQGSLPPLEGALTPVYSTTEGLTQKRLRQWMGQALALVASSDALPELLPVEARLQQQSIADALQFLHQPPVDQLSPEAIGLLEQQQHPSQQRLAFEELVAHHVSLLQLRQKVRRHQAPALAQGHELKQDLLNQLPFALTGAQQRVSDTIAQDLAQSRPMLRLIQGDVGCGKTIVAALAVLQTVGSGQQAAVMAPTEILAEQHLKNFQAWMQPLGIGVAWLSGKQTQKIRREQLEALAQGSAQVVVGTHALFQQQVEFKNLGLVVIDEQHRFGVHQRLALREKGVAAGQVPHQLIMTATPIPRSLAMCAYADLDLSVIDELPPGRVPIETLAISDVQRDKVIGRVREACGQGRQAYWVCTLIEESEVLQCQAAEVTATALAEALPELNIGLVHGRLKAAEKSRVMDEFKAGRLHLLVATTVIEVGVDVPNASLMIIENPERLGLAQLHQLRGRIGRGTTQSFCVLMYHPPLSGLSKRRLMILRDSNDGFVVAEKDLELRGPGELLGTRQTGLMTFKIADFQRDAGLMGQVRQRAKSLLKTAPDVAPLLIKRWLGSSDRYAEV